MSSILRSINEKIVSMKRANRDYIEVSSAEYDEIKEDETTSNLLTVLNIKIEVKFSLKERIEQILIYNFEDTTEEHATAVTNEIIEVLRNGK